MTLRLADISRSATAALGVPGFDDLLELGDPRHVVLLLVDGLGELQRKEFSTPDDPLSAGIEHQVACPIPSTTPVGLASLGTGLDPGQHGLVGASFYLPEEDRILSPLHWGDVPLPLAVQPEPTIFELASQSGVHVTSIGPASYENSGLTRAVLRGADYRAAEDIPQRLAGVRSSLGSTVRSLDYVYWPHLDRLGHEFGPGSPQWCAGLEQVQHLVRGINGCLGEGSVLVVTSDHGMVSVEPEDRIWIEATPGLKDGVVAIAGEPRARHVYCRPGAAVDVASTWNELLAGRAQVMTRQEVVASGWLGVCDEFLEDRIGDVVAFSLGGYSLASHVDPKVSQLQGQHGSFTEAEILIPGLVLHPSQV